MHSSKFEPGLVLFADLSRGPSSEADTLQWPTLCLAHRPYCAGWYWRSLGSCTASHTRKGPYNKLQRLHLESFEPFKFSAWDWLLSCFGRSSTLKQKSAVCARYFWLARWPSVYTPLKPLSTSHVHRLVISIEWYGQIIKGIKLVSGLSTLLDTQPIETVSQSIHWPLAW